ncbi:hypothetical protein ACIA8O_05345 [Kitasatospora sp. NPDC051853]|uniref:hypothetical protein n=1 Tax=Kitasatospora sp. NPDC051853 TaxID=3364058 RepID=UPI0037936E71
MNRQPATPPAGPPGGPSPAPPAGRLPGLFAELGSAAWTARLLGLALVLAADAAVASTPAAWLALLPFTVPAAWFAAPSAPGAAASGSNWQAVLSRHRPTAFATGCVLLAALGGPPLWLAAAFTALLLGYLLYVDRLTSGSAAPSPRRQPAPAAAYGAAALVLAAAAVPVGRAAPGPLVALLAVAGAALAAAVALWAPGGVTGENGTEGDGEGPRPE